MHYHFQIPDTSLAHILEPYYSMRHNRSCDTGLLDTFIWKDYYRIQICIADEKAVLLLMQNEEEFFTALPYCAEEDLFYYFLEIKKYFNEVLHKPLKVYLADEEGVLSLGLSELPGYLVREEADFKDYLYAGDDLRQLPGKKFHQKRNQISHFNREYEGRWEYVTLSCRDQDEILEFLDAWYAAKMVEEQEGGQSGTGERSGEDNRENPKKETTDAADESDGLNYERSGILDILRDCSSLSYHMGGIRIDGHLEAFTIGTYNPLEDMAVISVEKANSAFAGIYQVINQQFLLHEFPEVSLVNREDDVGIPGLRRAKESYRPVGFARKYMILQTDFQGYKEELTDYYEKNI